MHLTEISAQVKSCRYILYHNRYGFSIVIPLRQTCGCAGNPCPCLRERQAPAAKNMLDRQTGICYSTHRTYNTGRPHYAMRNGRSEKG